MIIGKNSIENYSCFDLAKIFPMGSWEILKNIKILENIIALISQDEFDWWQVEKYWKIEILENIPALISHKMCLTDGKLRNIEKYWNIRKYYCVDLARFVWLMASWEILKTIEILENIPALISQEICLTDGKLRNIEILNKYSCVDLAEDVFDWWQVEMRN